MNNMPEKYNNDFDFIWSSCALEDLSALEHGIKFILNSLRMLKPGGIAVHTKEFNVSSNFETIESGETVLIPEERYRINYHYIGWLISFGSGFCREFN